MFFCLSAFSVKKYKQNYVESLYFLTQERVRIMTLNRGNEKIFFLCTLRFPTVGGIIRHMQVHGSQL